MGLLGPGFFSIGEGGNTFALVLFPKGDLGAIFFGGKKRVGGARHFEDWAPMGDPPWGIKKPRAFSKGRGGPPPYNMARQFNRGSAPAGFHYPGAVETRGSSPEGVIHPGRGPAGVPYVLAGSHPGRRDRCRATITGRLHFPEGDEEHIRRCTGVIMIATALHSIATGNMLPSYVWREETGEVRPLTTICVDSSEFVVSKLKDRGTHQAFGVITNAQDFLHVLRFYVEQEAAERARAPQTAGAA